MKHFKVTVNGSVYDVEVEEVSASTQSVKQSAPIPAETSPAVSIVKSADTPLDGKSVDSPMAGKIIDVKVKAGEAVNVNQTIVILEAMKMENEIVTPYAGVVTGISVTVGQTVNSGDVLISVS